jgi:putative membrane protein
MKRSRHMVVLAGAAVMVVAAIVIATAVGAAATRSALLSTQDQAYLATAHQGNLAEIAAGRVGQQKATSQVVRRLAGEFVADHTRLDSDLMVVAQQLNVPVPELPSAAQRDELAAVVARSGTTFDTAWLRSELAAQRLAMAAAHAELARGADGTVKALARRGAPVVQSHVTALEQALGGGAPTRVNAGSGGQAAQLPAGTAAAGRTLLALGAAVVIGSAVLFGPRRRRTA